MNFRLIKYKITFWYTLIIVVVFFIVLGGAFVYTEHYGESEIKNELIDEVEDLRKDIIRRPKSYQKMKLSNYIEDGVMLSVYDENYEITHGILPDEFPLDVEFSENGIKKVGNEDDKWFVNDAKLIMKDGSVLWIRGIRSYSPILIMIQRLIRLMTNLFPVLAVFIAYIGYKMIKKCLEPVHVITETANEITTSSSLTRRIPLPESKDEFYYLSETMNRMLEHLEENFLKEHQFSSDAAHELRTPLSIILSHCEYCLDELEPSQELREELLIIQSKAQQMSKLVVSLLTISREEKKISNLEYELVDLKLLAESVAEEMEEKAGQKEINIEIINKLEYFNIYADMAMLMRLFMNLVDNSIIYGKQGGYVKIIMEDKQDNIMLTFEDNGIGISKEEQKKIWNRFYQADKSRSKNKGFGLGLSMVKQIVDAHNGTIVVESEEGKGSRFIVEIPRNRQAD